MAEVTLFEQIGGAGVGAALVDVLKGLRPALKLLQGKRYSSQIDEFGFHLMVSGEITNFKEPSGCAGLRLMKKRKYIKLRSFWGKRFGE
jgi:hypothetical protein